MTGVWEFPNLEELREFIEGGVQASIQSLQDDVSSDRLILLQRSALEKVVIHEEWGRGTATVGEDPLNVVFFYSIGDVDRSENPDEYDNILRVITQRFNSLVNEGVITPPEPAVEWFPSLEPIFNPIERLEETVNLLLGRREGNTVFDLSTMQAIEFEEPRELPPPEEGTEPVPFEQLNRIPLDILRERAREPPSPRTLEDDLRPAVQRLEEEIEEEEDEEEAEIPLKQLPAEERLERGFSRFREDGEVTVPAGKGAKTVEDREPYDFEIRMGIRPEALPEFGFSGAELIGGGIAQAKAFQRFGVGEAPSTYPRTGVYVKNRLLFEGPAYILELYRDLVWYTGFINAFYGYTLKPGRYSAFREFMYRLNRIGEEGGPQLVNRLSQQGAAQRELETIPDHPTIEGENAPWLQRRQYYEIVEENSNHPAWENPTEFLYEEILEQ